MRLTVADTVPLPVSGALLATTLLDETGKLEFALTSPSFDSFLEYEHSEFLPAWGAVEAWVESLN
jgi:hypothetical protein